MIDDYFPPAVTGEACLLSTASGCFKALSILRDARLLSQKPPHWVDARVWWEIAYDGLELTGRGLDATYLTPVFTLLEEGLRDELPT